MYRGGCVRCDGLVPSSAAQRGLAPLRRPARTSSRKPGGASMTATTAPALRRVLALVLLLGATLGLADLAAGPSFAASKANLYVVQGLPGRSVDVTIDGKTVAKGVKTAAVVGPFKVAPGS